MGKQTHRPRWRGPLTTDVNPAAYEIEIPGWTYYPHLGGWRVDRGS